MQTQKSTQTETKSTLPTHNIRRKIGYGKQANFETIGVAWERDDGGLYIKLHGIQVVDSGFYAFAVPEAVEEGSLEATK